MTGENGIPETPEWTCQPHRDCELHAKSREPLTIPSSIILGEN